MGRDCPARERARRLLLPLVFGMLVVVRPGAEGFEPAAFYGIASALCWSAALILTRKMTATDPSSTTVLWSSWIGWGLLTLALPLGFAWPTPKQWIMLVGLGVLASLGQWMTILSFRYAQASLLMPFSEKMFSGTQFRSVPSTTDWQVATPFTFTTCRAFWTLEMETSFS